MIKFAFSEKAVSLTLLRSTEKGMSYSTNIYQELQPCTSYCPEQPGYSPTGVSVFGGAAVARCFCLCQGQAVENCAYAVAASLP